MAETTQRHAPTATNTETSLKITRRIHATPEEVFDAWTDAEGMAVWMTPGDSKHSRVTIDPRVGGRFQIDMVGDKATYEHRGEYLIVDRPRKLSFTWISKPTNEQRTVVTVELKPVGADETELTLTHEGLPSADSTKGHAQGWGVIVEKLAARFER